MLQEPKRIDSTLEQLALGPHFSRELIYGTPPELRKQRPALGVWSVY